MSVVDTIAAALGETESTPVKTIGRLVRVIGEERAQALLEETLKLEAGDGMLTEDGQRRRTPGGTFFKLAKERLSTRERGKVFGPPPKPKAATPKKPVAPLSWEDLLPVVTDLLANPPQGVAHKMKLTVIGKPGKIIEKGEMVLTSLQSGPAPSLPKGLPNLPAEPTITLVFIAAKQWRKVQPALQADPSDRMIVEGFPVLDKRIKGGTLCLYAQSVTTIGMQRAKRDAG
ncbi:MAG: hypothetical protein FOGNACKC_05939 [Anaerolineae bacterium]|nr:hypothetical protein [Anaerolineae bacterium]